MAEDTDEHVDSDSGDVAAETLERVNFQATQQATQGDGSTVPQGTTVDYTVSVAQDGTIDESQNGDYLFVGNADTDSDSDSEAVICVANPGGGLGQGMKFGPNEKWKQITQLTLSPLSRTEPLMSIPTWLLL